ncbi:DUF5336 domain-containing protein [[Mycobacterium] burgundiense]|uniref:DUF5336 domain-containing protein n=1 Tax=[Mycobacterium] burgundiense TaxID=3064286 RepID=A0ABM9LDD3_9MYCO|nr:DUF5336 domain-containing protein [Mycolicibacterium sp. MU0053]CAJ1497081.1 DUF5336 domain-containing protein [Mycolicibacterium sp. MU0053]
MTYSPGSPGSSGYPSAQPPGSYGAPAPFGQAAESGPSKLPLYLSVAVAVLGLIAYLLTFGPMFTLSAEVGPFVSEVTAGGSGLPILAALAAALLAGAGLLPKANNYHAVVAVLATLGALLALSDLLGKPDGFSVGWAFWVFLAATVLQSVAAIVALLFDSGLITPPAPRPRYDQGQYGQYGPPGGYYGQPSQPVPGPGQRPGYPSQYGGYGGPQQPQSGGYGAPQGAQQQGGSQQGSPTPPTGYPTFSPPPSVGSGPAQGGGPISPSAPTQQAPTQPPSNGPSSS